MADTETPNWQWALSLALGLLPIVAIAVVVVVSQVGDRSPRQSATKVGHPESIPAWVPRPFAKYFLEAVMSPEVDWHA